MASTFDNVCCCDDQSIAAASEAASVSRIGLRHGEFDSCLLKCEGFEINVTDGEYA